MSNQLPNANYLADNIRIRGSLITITYRCTFTEAKGDSLNMEQFDVDVNAVRNQFGEIQEVLLGDKHLKFTDDQFGQWAFHNFRILVAKAILDLTRMISKLGIVDPHTLVLGADRISEKCHRLLKEYYENKDTTFEKSSTSRLIN